MNDDRLKEFYRLWWEFLTRSSIVDNLRQLASAYEGGGGRESFAVADSLPDGAEGYVSQFFGLLVDEGLTFEEFWRGSHLRHQTLSPPPVMDGYEYLRQRAAMTAAGGEFNRGWSSAESFLSGVESSDKERGGTILLAISANTGEPVNDTLKAIREQITAARKAAGKAPGFPQGTGPNELQRYLDVYDAHTDFNSGRAGGQRARRGTWGHVIEATGRLESVDTSSPDYAPENMLREVVRDFDLARKIIRNVERGEFPGKRRRASLGDK